MEAECRYSNAPFRPPPAPPPPRPQPHRPTLARVCSTACNGRYHHHLRMRWRRSRRSPPSWRLRHSSLPRPLQPQPPPTKVPHFAAPNSPRHATPRTTTFSISHSPSAPHLRTPTFAITFPTAAHPVTPAKRCQSTLRRTYIRPFHLLRYCCRRRLRPLLLHVPVVCALTPARDSRPTPCTRTACTNRCRWMWDNTTS